MNNKAEKKTEKLTYDEDGGLVLMKNWSPTLRWISILPAIIIIFIVVKFLFLGAIVNRLEKESYLLSFYVTAITSGLVYLAVVDIVAAIAPKKRVLVSIITAISFGLIVVIVSVINLPVFLNGDFVISKKHIMIGLGIAFLSSILGLYLGVRLTIDRQKKAENLNVNIES